MLETILSYILLVLAQILLGLASTISFVGLLFSKFMYLLMDSSRKSRYRGVVAAKILELESQNRNDKEQEVFLSIAIQPLKELHCWMCANAKD